MDMNTTTRNNLALELSSRSKAQSITEFSIFLLINVTALLGNTMVCWIFFRNVRLQTVTNIYIITLALCDMAFTLMCMPVVDGVLFTGQWIYPEWMCRIQGFLVLLLCFLSLHTIALTALNRYFRVVKPNLFKRIFTKKMTVISVVLVFLVAAFLLAFPLLMGWAFLLFHPGKMACSLQFHDRHIDIGYSSFLAVVIVFTPFITIILCYRKVFQAVQIHKRRLSVSEAEANTSGDVHRDKLTAEEVNITKTLFGIVLGFSVCWGPVFVIEFVDSFYGSYKLPRFVYFVYTFLVSVSATVNPIIYGVMNKTFRREYMGILRSCRNRSRVEDDTVGGARLQTWAVELDIVYNP